MVAEPNGNILVCAYQVGSKMSSARQLQTGGTYQPPPKPQGIEPDLSESFDSWQQNVCQAVQMVSEKTGKPGSVATGMVRAYQVHCMDRLKHMLWTEPALSSSHPSRQIALSEQRPLSDSEHVCLICL